MFMTIDKLEAELFASLMAEDYTELQELHLKTSARLFETAPGMPRVIAAQDYIRVLDELRRETRALRNVEILRAVTNGVGPSEMGRALDRSKARGAQAIDEAQKDDEAQAIVNRLRRRLTAWRRGKAGMTVVDTDK